MVGIESEYFVYTRYHTYVCEMNLVCAYYIIVYPVQQKKRKKRVTTRTTNIYKYSFAVGIMYVRTSVSYQQR